MCSYRVRNSTDSELAGDHNWLDLDDLRVRHNVAIEGSRGATTQNALGQKNSSDCNLTISFWGESAVVYQLQAIHCQGRQRLLARFAGSSVEPFVSDSSQYVTIGETSSRAHKQFPRHEASLHGDSAGPRRKFIFRLTVRPPCLKISSFPTIKAALVSQLAPSGVKL
jgi:hypothetical protein